MQLRLVRKFPEQRFVLDHMAKPSIRDGTLEPWKKDMETLAKSPNVWCKVSGMVTEANWNSWLIEDFKSYLDVVFQSFGSDRIMYGSDWPVSLLAASYQQQLEIIENYIAPLSASDKLNIMGENARKFYNL